MRANLPSRSFDMNIQCTELGLAQLHRLAVLLLAALRGIHEREDLERLLVRYRRLARLEELHDLHHQGPVIGSRRGLRMALHRFPPAKRHGAVIAIRTDRVHRADSSVLPSP